MHSLSDVIGIVISLVLVMFSATLHEVAHGYAAYKLGDPTAKMAGRLTLNPKAHIDPAGSIVLPLLMALAGGPIFAFAKPVPYNPNNLRNPTRDEVIVAFAGPLCNILQALAGTAVVRLLWLYVYPTVSSGFSLVFTYIAYILSTYVYINLVLAFFKPHPDAPARRVLDHLALPAWPSPREVLRGPALLDAYTFTRHVPAADGAACGSRRHLPRCDSGSAL